MIGYTTGMTPTAGTSPGRPPGVAAGILLGLGFGGFLDGIVLHQILQWHHMVSHQETVATVAGLELNTLADGFFHLATWVLVLAGSVTMLRDWQQGRLAPSWSFHVGLLLVGWGLFNLGEGVVDHHLLQAHHVRDDLGGPLAWDLGFLLLGAGLVVVGVLLHRRGRQVLRPAPRAGEPARISR